MRELFKRVFKKEEGFSLIELIIVIAILAIIAAIAVPNLLANIRRANEGADISNAKLIADSIATVIAQNPEYEGDELTDENFEAASTEAIVDDALATFSGTAPTIKASVNGDSGDAFIVNLTAEGVITVEGPTSPTPLYPQ
jgi:type IV pilus assembly protein PilA